MKAEIKTITPTLAVELLSRNETNRPIRKYVVEAYAKEMKAGTWNLTGQGITVGSNGQLLDGQHRLCAIIEADVSIPMLVVTDADVVATYDAGLRRSLHDQVRLQFSDKNGYWYDSNGLSIVRTILNLNKFNKASSKRMSISTAEIIEFLDKHEPELETIRPLLMGGSSQSSKILRRSIIPATLWMMKKANSDVTDELITHIITVLKSGISTEDYDAPIIALRNKLYELKSVTRADVTSEEVCLRIQFMVQQLLKGATSAVNKPIARAYDFTKVVL